MKNTAGKNTAQKDEQQLQGKTNSVNNGLVERPAKSGERTKQDNEDAGGTGLGHRKDQGREDDGRKKR